MFEDFEQAANSVDIGQEFKKIHKNIRWLKTPKQVRIPLSTQ